MLASGYPLWWQAKFQYDAFIVMILFLAAVDGAARLQRRWRAAGLRLPRGKDRGWDRGWPATVWAAVVFVAAIGYLPFSPFGQLLHPKYYMVNARMQAADQATARVPSGVEVEAADNLGPRLSGRDTVLLLDGAPRWAPWVVADTKGLDFPFCTPAQQAQEVSFLRAHGYRLVFSDDGYVVLHRPADARTREALIHPVPAPRDSHQRLLLTRRGARRGCVPWDVRDMVVNCGEGDLAEAVSDRRRSLVRRRGGGGTSQFSVTSTAGTRATRARRARR